VVQNALRRDNPDRPVCTAQRAIIGEKMKRIVLAATLVALSLSATVAQAGGVYRPTPTSPEGSDWKYSDSVGKVLAVYNNGNTVLLDDGQFYVFNTSKSVNVQPGEYVEIDWILDGTSRLARNVTVY
jgi:hypothetical protein